MNPTLKMFALDMASHMEHDCVHALIEDADEILEYILDNTEDENEVVFEPESVGSH
jgi:hypothetical protein